jgi:hypothetical protein
MLLQTKRWIVISLSILGLLLIPFIAMQFTDEVNWAPGDFVVMGAILFSLAFAYEFIARRFGQTGYRVAFAIGLLGAFLLFWVNAAVGIIGNEGQVANLLYGAVFVVGIVGALIARFKPIGLSRALFAAALTQVLVPVIALLIWPPTMISWSPSVAGVFMISGFFALLFVVSGVLFRRAGRS